MTIFLKKLKNAKPWQILNELVWDRAWVLMFLNSPWNNSNLGINHFSRHLGFFSAERSIKKLTSGGSLHSPWLKSHSSQALVVFEIKTHTHTHTQVFTHTHTSTDVYFKCIHTNTLNFHPTPQGSFWHSFSLYLRVPVTQPSQLTQKANCHILRLFFPPI